MQDQFETLEEDEGGGGGGGLLAMLAGLLAFLGHSFLPAFRLMFKGLWGLGKVLGRFAMKLPLIGGLFRKLNEHIFGKRGIRDPKTGRFVKREHIGKKIARRFKGSKLAKLFKFGKKAGTTEEEAGGAAEDVGGVAEAGEGALAGGEAVAGTAEVAGTAAMGGEAAGGVVALASNPIGWIVAAVLGAAVAAFLAWKYVIPKKWKTKIKGVLSDIGHAAVKVWHGMEKVGKVIGHGMEVILSVYKRVAVDIIGAVSLLWKATKPIRKFFDNVLISGIKEAWKVIQTVGKWFGKAVGEFKKGLIAIKNVLMPIFNFIGHAAEIVKHALGKAWHWFSNLPGVKQTISAVKSGAKEVVRGAKVVVKGAVSAEAAVHAQGEQTLSEKPSAKKPVRQTVAAKPHPLVHHVHHADHDIVYRHIANDRALAARLIHEHTPISRTPAFHRTVGSLGNQAVMPVTIANRQPIVHVHAPAERSVSATRNVPVPNQNIPTLDNTPVIVDDSGLIFLNLSAY